MSLQFLQFLQMQGSGKAGFQHPFQCQSCMNSSIKFWCQILSEEGYLLENLLTISKGKFWKGLGMFRFKKINFTLTKNLEIITRVIYNLWGTLGGLDGKESACRAGDLDLIPGLGRSPGEEWPPTPVVLPGEFHGQRSLARYSPWGHKETHN